MSDFIFVAHIFIPAISPCWMPLPHCRVFFVRTSGRHPLFDGRAKNEQCQDNKNAITNTATAFYNYPSLVNCTIFTAKSTGKPLFYSLLVGYPQFYETLWITVFLFFSSFISFTLQFWEHYNGFSGFISKRQPVTTSRSYFH